ncbi:hypothetical protein B0H16DRAFT_1831490 [Mycena metata]|uniref:Uncharacterized protein n=1 Tax=Mycena metata TaxID=1033252 RepID=A0AAD7J2G8_9AGAR|nr:hypothetical protein B0H16DRAFT_1831490 [Mycena metata]
MLSDCQSPLPLFAKSDHKTTVNHHWPHYSQAPQSSRSSLPTQVHKHGSLSLSPTPLPQQRDTTFDIPDKLLLQALQSHKYKQEHIVSSKFSPQDVRSLIQIHTIVKTFAMVIQVSNLVASLARLLDLRSFLVSNPRLQSSGLGPTPTPQPVPFKEAHPVSSSPNTTTGDKDKDEKGAGVGREGEVGGQAYRATLSRHSAGVDVIRFSPNDELIASAGNDRMVIIWARSLTPPAHSAFASSSDADPQLEKEFWKPRTTFRCTTMQVYDLAWSPSGEFLVAGSTDNVGRVFASVDCPLLELVSRPHFV